MLPSDCDVIPAFSFVELELSIKGWSAFNDGDVITMPSGKQRTITAKDVCPVAKGYGLNLNSIKLVNGSVYSVVEKLFKIIGSTADRSRDTQRRAIETYPSIAQVLQSTQAPFMVRDICRDAYFTYDSENDIVKVTQWTLGEEDAIDVSGRDAMRFTNSCTVRDACMLMELACNTECLSLMCMHNRYRKDRKDESSPYSVFYGVPLIDTEKMLASVRKVDFSTSSFRKVDNAGVAPASSSSLVAADNCSNDVDSGCPVSYDDDFYSFQSGLSAIDDNGDEYEPVLLFSKRSLSVFPAAASTSTADGADGAVCTLLESTRLPIPFRSLLPDFLLSGPGMNMTRAYFIRVVKPCAEVVNAQGYTLLWKGYFNPARPCCMYGNMGGGAGGCSGGALSSAAGASMARKRWSDTDVVAEDDPMDPFGAGGANLLNGSKNTHAASLVSSATPGSANGNAKRACIATSSASSTAGGGGSGPNKARKTAVANNSPPASFDDMDQEDDEDEVAGDPNTEQHPFEEDEEPADDYPASKADSNKGVGGGYAGLVFFGSILWRLFHGGFAKSLFLPALLVVPLVKHHVLLVH